MGQEATGCSAAGCWRPWAGESRKGRQVPPDLVCSCVPSTVFPQERGLLPGVLVAGISQTSPEGVRLGAGTADTCPRGPGEKHRGGLGVVLEGTVETVAKEKASPG